MSLCSKPACAKRAAIVLPTAPVAPLIASPVFAVPFAIALGAYHGRTDEPHVRVIHPSAWKGYSRKFAVAISAGPTPLGASVRGGLPSLPIRARTPSCSAASARSVVNVLEAAHVLL